jgi:hypothetical protein
MVNQILLPLNTKDIKLKRTLTANKSILDVSDGNTTCLSLLTQHMILNRQRQTNIFYLDIVNYYIN